MFIPHHQNAGQNPKINIANKFLETGGGGGGDGGGGDSVLNSDAVSIWTTQRR
jgi:GTPase involved in cell partitioning and DNA repair